MIVYYESNASTDPEPVTEVEYFLAGDFNGWGFQDADYKLTVNPGNNAEYMFEGLTLTDDGGIKVNSSESIWYPDGNNYMLEAGTYNIYFRPDGQGGSDWHYGYIYAEKQNSDDPEPTDPVADGYYLVGDFNSWTANADYQFAENTATAGEYMLTTNLTAGDKLKVAKVEGGNIVTWYPDGENNDYVVNVSGEHTIYFRPDGQGADDWYNGVFYVDGENVPVGSYSLTCTNTSIATVEFKLGDVTVTTASPNDEISAIITLDEGYAVDVENTKVEAWASFSDAQAQLMAPGMLRNVDFIYEDATKTISFTMPEANVRVTVATIVDKTELEETIDDAENLLDQIDDDEIAGTLQEAINDAKDVDEYADATAAEVTQAVQDLKDAMDAAQSALDALKVQVTVKAGEFVTMYLEKNRKVEETETSVKLYTVTTVNVEEEKVVLSSELSVVGDKTPFLLYNEGTADATVTLVVAGTPDQVSVAPEFKGTLEAKAFTAADLEAADYYTLHGSNFVWTPEAGTIAANRCWLQLDKSGGAPASLSIVFGDDTTGIKSLTPTLSEGEGVYYDLSGRRVAQPTKGLYIINGRKVLMK